jgi:hypothetical protein
MPLPLGLRLDGRFDLNYERRGLGATPARSTARASCAATTSFSSSHARRERDPIGFSVELIALTTWEAHFRHRFGAPLVLVVRGGKLLVPFGNDPLFHQPTAG